VLRYKSEELGDLWKLPKAEKHNKQMLSAFEIRLSRDKTTEVVYTTTGSF
jgi:hypothetical protein